MQLISAKKHKTRHDLIEKVIHWEIQIWNSNWPYEQMVYEKPWIDPEEWNPQNSLGFWDKNVLLNLVQSDQTKQ